MALGSNVDANTCAFSHVQVIPRQLCNNAGFDATDVLNKLRQKHATLDGSGKVNCEEP